MNKLAEQLTPFFNLLLFWNDQKSPYYLMIVFNGDHQKVLTYLEEKASYLYLRRFLLPTVVPSLTIGTNLLDAAQLNAHQSITPAVLSHFAHNLMEWERNRLGEFLQSNTM